jgi:hypothetical protein
MTRPDLDTELSSLAAMDLDALRHLWRRRLKSQPPKLGTSLLRLALAYAIQEKALGGLSRASQKHLEALSTSTHTGQKVTRLRQPRPGMRLVRVWNDVAHVVTITEAGEVEWQGKHWRSLSEVARAITGTRWSGPRFFGLRDQRSAA